jgi:hypothetical protein
MDPLEILWDALLSRQPDQVRAGFNTLDDDSRSEVLAHLQEMAGGDGWHPEQAASALAALDALRDEGG